MSDKLEDFMKRNAPEATGPLKALRVPSRNNWIAGITVSTALAATLVVTLINRTPDFDPLNDEIAASFGDELPEGLQDYETFYDAL